MALVPVYKKKVLGHDTESELVGFLKFRISGILKVALLSFKSSSHITLKTSKKLSDKKLSFSITFCFCKSGRRIEFLLECGLSLVDKCDTECLRMAVPPFRPPWDHANNQLPSTSSCSHLGVGVNLQAAIFAICCSNLEMRSS